MENILGMKETVMRPVTPPSVSTKADQFNEWLFRCDEMAVATDGAAG
jgi:hypothetical protein